MDELKKFLTNTVNANLSTRKASGGWLRLVHAPSITTSYMCAQLTDWMSGRPGTPFERTILATGNHALCDPVNGPASLKKIEAFLDFVEDFVLCLSDSKSAGKHTPMSQSVDVKQLKELKQLEKKPPKEAKAAAKGKGIPSLDRTELCFHLDEEGFPDDEFLVDSALTCASHLCSCVERILQEQDVKNSSFTQQTVADLRKRIGRLTIIHEAMEALASRQGDFRPLRALIQKRLPYNGMRVSEAADEISFKLEQTILTSVRREAAPLDSTPFARFVSWKHSSRQEHR
jgi:hypothetical protein